MAKNKVSAKDRIAKTLAKRPATKRALANSLGLNYVTVSTEVNALVTEKRIVVVRPKLTGKRGRPATIYAAVEATDSPRTPTETVEA